MRRLMFVVFVAALGCGAGCEKAASPQAEQGSAAPAPPAPPKPPPAPAQPVGMGRPLQLVTPSDLPPACESYKAAIDALSKCDKMPKEARVAMKQAFDQASAGWKNLPPETRAALATACAAGTDAVKQALQACQ